MLFMPSLETISWSDIFHTSREIGVKFVMSMNRSELGEAREIVEDIGGVHLMIRCPLIR